MDVFQMRSMNDSVMVSALRLPEGDLHQIQACVPRSGPGAPGWGVGCLLVHKPNTTTTRAAPLSFVRGLRTCNRWLRRRFAGDGTVFPKKMATY